VQGILMTALTITNSDSVPPRISGPQGTTDPRGATFASPLPVGIEDS
jgi:hypothetical protein